MHQLDLPLSPSHRLEHSPNQSYYARLTNALSQDLDFHHQDSSYASHNYHAFPAKFPPQLPRAFIRALTNPGDAVLDPMMGSGTTILEAFLAGRRGIGCDIDPLAALITKVKVTPLDSDRVRLQANELLTKATQMLNGGAASQPSITENHFDPKTRTFIDYWFHDNTQAELGVLIAGINAIPDPDMKAFFQLAFSAIIITKSGGVSLALDLAHTRPHRAKLVMDVNGSILYGRELAENPLPRTKYVTKTLRSPLVEYQKRIRQNLNHLVAAGQGAITPGILFGDAQSLPIQSDSIDLIVTSPPYASNAIDYMRAHKFSLVWMGYPIQALGDKRR
ncbi:MAG TPA: site-specific DNA-methyltransferase, partial [Caldilineae bacterium]|nr:site-specific DNA-methyltransferase [Caldilineae bacterium]